MSGFTRLGTAIWDWEPFIDLDNNTRVLWLALYTSATAKRNVPGLWHGSVASMADAARMQADDTIQSLDKLIDRELAEFDTKLRVLRLTSLPDCGESPTNGKTIHGWWNKFTVMTPACAIRDAHVPTTPVAHGGVDAGQQQDHAVGGPQERVGADVRRYHRASGSEARRPSSGRLGHLTRDVQCGLFENRSDSLSQSLSDQSYPQPVSKPVENSKSNDFAAPDRLCPIHSRKEQDQDPD